MNKNTDAHRRLQEAAASAERDATLAVIRAGLDDSTAHRTKPARAALKAIAKKYGIDLSGDTDASGT